MHQLCCVICKTSFSSLVSLDIYLDSKNTISRITRRLFPFLLQFDSCNEYKVCYSCSFYVNLSRLLLHTCENLSAREVTFAYKCDLCFETETSAYYNSCQYPGNQYFDVLKQLIPSECTLNKFFQLCYKCKYHIEGWIKLQGIAALGILTEEINENGSPEELENKRLYKQVTMKRKGDKLVRKNSVAGLHRTNKTNGEATTSATKGLACRLRSLSVPLTDIIKNNSVKYQLGFEEEEHGVWKFKPHAKQIATRYHKQKINASFNEDVTMRFAKKHNLRTKSVIDKSLSVVESQNKSESSQNKSDKSTVQSRRGRKRKSTDSSVSPKREVVLITGSKVHAHNETPRLSPRSSKNKAEKVDQVKPLRLRSSNNCVENNHSQKGNVKISEGLRSGSISPKADVEQKCDSKKSLNTVSVRKSFRKRTSSIPQEAKKEKNVSPVGRLRERESDTKVVRNIQRVLRTIKTPKKSESLEQLSPVEDATSVKTLSLRSKRKSAGTLSVGKLEVKKSKVENVGVQKKLFNRKQSVISSKRVDEVGDELDSDVKMNKLGIPYSRTNRKRSNKVKMNWCNICGIELDSVESKLKHEFTHQESRLLFVSLHRCNLNGPSVKLPVYVDCEEVAALKNPREDFCTSADDSYSRPVLEVENVLNEDECDAYEDYSDSEEENQTCIKEKDFLEEAASKISPCNANEESFLGDASLANVTKADQSLSSKSPKKFKKKGHVKMRLWENTQPQITRCGRVIKLTQKYEERKLVLKKSTSGIEKVNIDESPTDKICDPVNSSQEKVDDYVEVVVEKEHLKKNEESNETSQESIISCEDLEQSGDLNELTEPPKEFPSEKTDVHTGSNEGNEQVVSKGREKLDKELTCSKPALSLVNGCEINSSDESTEKENVGKTVGNVTTPSIDYLEDADTEDAPSHVLAKAYDIKDEDQFVGLKKKLRVTNNDSEKVENGSDIPKNTDLNVTLEDSNIQSNNQDGHDAEKAARKDTSETSKLIEPEVSEKSNEEYLKNENGSTNATGEVESKLANKSNVNVILEYENGEEADDVRNADSSLHKTGNMSEAEKTVENGNGNISDSDTLENKCIQGSSEKSDSSRNLDSSLKETNLSEADKVTGDGNGNISDDKVTGDGNGNISDDKVTGDGNGNISDDKVTGDGNGNISDDKVTGDGNGNISDDKVTGDGNGNISDEKVTGDGNGNISDDKVTGDGNGNISDDKVTGDGNGNISDDKVTGDGNGNISDEKVTGDGNGNISDDKVTGDGNGNISDDKVTGDGNGNISDDKVTGDGHGNISDDKVTGDRNGNISDDKVTGDGNGNISDADIIENDFAKGTSEKCDSRDDDRLCTKQDGLEDISDEEFDFNDEEQLNRKVSRSLECINEGEERKAEEFEHMVGAEEDGGEEQSDNLEEEDNMKMGDVGSDGRIAFQMALESVEAVLEDEGSRDKSECLENDSEEFYREKVKVVLADDVETEFENVSVEEEEEVVEEEEEGVEDIEKAEIAEGGGEDFGVGDKDEISSYLGGKSIDESEKEYESIGDGGMDPSTENVETEDTKEEIEGCNKIPVEMADVDDSRDPDHCISSDKLDSVILGRKYDDIESSSSDKQKEGFSKANDASNDNIVCERNEDMGDGGCDIEGYDSCALNGITDIVNAPLPFEDVSVVTSADRYTEGKDKTATECEG